MRAPGLAIAAVTAAIALLAPAPASAAPPWQAADEIRAELFSAQTDLLFDEPGESSVAAARRALAGPLERGLRADAPGELAEISASLAAAEAAFAAGDGTALAAARGRILSALRRGAYRVTVAATARGDAATADSWLLIRDFRQATRFTRPGVDATAALGELASGEMSPADATVQVRKDLLDAYQVRLAGNLDDALQAAERGFGDRLAETAAIARGYWLIIAAEYREQRGAAAARRTTSDFAALAAAAGRGDVAAFRTDRTAVLEDLDGFTAAPFTPEEQARRAQQLTRFLDLVPIEYDDGTEDGRVTIPFELQEAVAFQEGAEQAFTELEAPLLERDPALVAEAQRGLDELERYAEAANERSEIAPVEDVDDAHARVSDALDELFPEEWKQSSDEADYDLVEISLDQLAAAAGAGEKGQAEQARLSAYAFFEFGPELKLRAFDPQLVTEIEGLFWYGARDSEGLAELISSGASVRDIRDTNLVLTEALGEARAKTGEGASDATVITNAALIVFREGLEAILIIAAITASLIGARRRLRQPIYRGALLALPASVLMFVIALLVLESLSQYGEKLEAVVGLIAIGVLLVVLNWFFHRVYWTEWIAGHRRRGQSLTGAAGAGAVVGTATIAGLYVLGFSSVFREGLETVLFLQALQLSSGTGVVIAGVIAGLALTALVGVATFKLEQRLPYKRMLVVTGVLIALVLVVLVGNTVRTLQGVGWIPITPLDFEFPLWMGTWLGFFPTWETLGAQVAALGFVIGSYFLAEWVRKRELRRASRSQPDPAPEAPDRSPLDELAHPATNGSNGHARSAPARSPDRSEPTAAPRRREPSKSR